MVFNATFNNISIVPRLSVLLVDETRVPRENHWPAANPWQTLSHNEVRMEASLHFGAVYSDIKVLFFWTFFFFWDSFFLEGHSFSQLIKWGRRLHYNLEVFMNCFTYFSHSVVKISTRPWKHGVKIISKTLSIHLTFVSIITRLGHLFMRIKNKINKQWFNYICKIHVHIYAYIYIYISTICQFVGNLRQVCGLSWYSGYLHQ